MVYGMEPIMKVAVTRLTQCLTTQHLLYRLIQLLRKKLLMLYSTDSGSICSPIDTEGPMEWQRATQYQYAFMPNDKVQNRKEKLHFQPASNESETYKLDADVFNPSAELARTYELIMKRCAPSGIVDHDFLARAASWEYIPTDRNPVLDDVKIIHNESTSYIADFIYKWIADWGEIEEQPSDKRYLFMTHYVQLAKEFYDYYTKILENKITIKDKETINANIRLHCDVGIKDNSVGIQPRNLRGFLWSNLASDVVEPKWHKACNREYCWRIAGNAMRADWKWCGNSCASYMAKTKKATRTDSIFDTSREHVLKAKLAKADDWSKEYSKKTSLKRKGTK